MNETGKKEGGRKKRRREKKNAGMRAGKERKMRSSNSEDGKVRPEKRGERKVNEASR